MVRCGGVAWHGMARCIVQWGVVEGSVFCVVLCSASGCGAVEVPCAVVRRGAVQCGPAMAAPLRLRQN